MKHNEAIANRNIDRYGSIPRSGSLPSHKDAQLINEHTGKQFDTRFRSLYHVSRVEV
jgi:hypothetical protein